MPPRTRTTTAARKAPQDRKPKQTRSRVKAVAAEASDQAFTFEADGKTYELPPAQRYASAVDGGTMMDAILDGDDMAQAKLTLMFVKAAAPDIDPEAYAALRAKPAREFMEIVGAWMEQGGVNPGESPRSSD